jgi:RNA polymerase sigma-70 factor (ECF subfamily)
LAGDNFQDKELLSLMAQDDHEAFEQLYKCYWLEMYDSAYRRLKNKKQAEDIVQEVFLSLWLRRRKQNIDNLPAYLHTAVKFRVFNYVERNLSHKSFYDPFVEIALSSKGTDSSLIEKELYNLLIAYINTLNEKKKEIFRLHFVENKSTKEIAEQLKIPRKTVQNQLRSIALDVRSRIAPILILFIGNHI